MDPIVKRLLENHNNDESNTQIIESRNSSNVDIKKLESEIREKVKEVMSSPEFGFENDYDDYSTVEVYDKDEYYEVEVRAEVSYDGMIEMADQLNPIVEKYDKEAYFDMVTTGIMSAYVMK